jgi:hypothetical protein
LVERHPRIPGSSIDVTALTTAGFRKKVILPSTLFVTPEHRALLLHALACLTEPR